MNDDIIFALKLARDAFTGLSDDLPHVAAVRGALLEVEKALGDTTDAEIFEWLEKQAKQSRTGISFDWVPPGEGQTSGWRFMRRFYVTEPRKSLRQAVVAAMNYNLGRSFE